MASIDLSHVPLADNHCHGIYQTQTPVDLTAWRRLFTESSDPEMRSKHVATTLFYRRLIREMAAFFECEQTEEAILAARQQHTDQSLVRTFLQAAHFDILFVDKGYPPPELLLSDTVVSDLANCRVAPILRVELLMQRLIAENDTLSAVVEALRAALNEVRGQGYVALKSIVAYRTGLDIRTWDSDESEEAFAVARREVHETGSLRLAPKPLLDTLLHVTFAEASRQGAYLATVYKHVYFDLSYGIPYLGYHEMVDFTRAALSVAPYSKLLYSSDAVGVPEIHWVSAVDGRRILGQVLGECVAHGDLSSTEAEEAGVAVLHDNAVRLYQC
jgi:uncharacterized protein